MAGQIGNERVTILNLEVVEADPERGLLLVQGAVPGPTAGCDGPHRRQGAGEEGGVTMATIDVLMPTGKKAGTRDLPAEVFGATVTCP